ncbi:MAG TPA: DUF397 domain-containing protein [Streptosporangiaceae bacterium]|nr:DUF397 domain-containing protein [Streptosporangiaceae bacterium]
MNAKHAPDVASLHWRKSSYSNAGNNCVEVGDSGTACAVRDSKNRDGGHLSFSAEAWQAFITDVKLGKYSL